MKSSRNGSCRLCPSAITPGDDIVSRLGEWVHSACSITAVESTTTHSPGYTYFLLLNDGAIKIGWSGRTGTLKDRIRRAHKNIAPVSLVLAVHEGGETLEASYHHRFRELADGRTETFLASPSLLATAEGGKLSGVTAEMNAFLLRNRSSWT